MNMTPQEYEREFLRLKLETFLREKYGLREQDFAAVKEDWDARGPGVMMVFRIGKGEIMRAAPLSEFVAWQERR